MYQYLPTFLSLFRTTLDIWRKFNKCVQSVAINKLWDRMFWFCLHSSPRMQYKYCIHSTRKVLSEPFLSMLTILIYQPFHNQSPNLLDNLGYLKMVHIDRGCICLVNMSSPADSKYFRPFNVTFFEYLFKLQSLASARTFLKLQGLFGDRLQPGSISGHLTLLDAFFKAVGLFRPKLLSPPQTPWNSAE